MANRNKQLKLLKEYPKAFGGDLLKTREGRAQRRPLVTTSTMHLILRSTKATGKWSFWLPQNKSKVKQIVAKFSNKYGIKVCSMANVGNHLHFQIKLANRFTYEPFIRALTAAIAMAITGASRWNPMRQPSEARTLEKRFWDRRPFTRVVVGKQAYLNLRDYLTINQMEGFGISKPEARFYLAWNDLRVSSA